MVKKNALEQVKKLASQLPAEARLKLFEHLAGLPDSGLIYHPPVTPPTSTVLPSDHTQEVLMMNVQLGWSVSEDGTRIYSYEGREVFRIKFDPNNYAESGFQLLKDHALQFSLSDAGRARIRASLEEYSREHQLSPTEEQYQRIETDVLQQYAHQLLRDSLVGLANNIDANLNQVTLAILGKMVQTAGFSVANLLRDTLQIPQQKIKVSDIQNIIYKAEWERLKTIVGIRSTQGGPRNVKHHWSAEELDCLAKTYQELGPVWAEAKQIARDAQKSRVGSRSKNWRDEVLRAFPDLPPNLLDRFQSLRADDAKPSDIALIHAKIKCGVEEEYTPRELSDKIRTLKLKKKPRGSPKSSKTRKVKPRR